MIGNTAALRRDKQIQTEFKGTSRCNPCTTVGIFACKGVGIVVTMSVLTGLSYYLMANNMFQNTLLL